MAQTPRPRAPRTTEAATRLLEQVAELDGQIAGIEAERQHSLAAINARADTAANDLLGRRAALVEALEPWWAAHGATLTGGKRKSIELGGCMIGSRAGRSALAVAGEESLVVEQLERLRWAKALLRVRTTLDRAAVLAELARGGARAARLAELCLSRREGEATFFVERARQPGTLAGAQGC